MSDNTPTERFDQPAEDLPPTAVLPSTPASPPVAPPPPPAPRAGAKSRGPLVAVIILGVLVIAAIVVLIVVLTTRGQSGVPTALSTQTSTPTTSMTAPPPSTPKPKPRKTHAPPPPAGPTFTSFNAPKDQHGCSSGGPDQPAITPNIQVSWATSNAKSVWIVQGTDDAADSGFMQVPLSGDQSDFPYPMQFACSQDSETLTMTMVGTGGQHVSRSWTVANRGDKF